MGRDVGGHMGRRRCLTMVFFCSTAQQCSQDSKGTMIVPIVVGIALAVLIAVVVVAYVISYVYHRKKTGSYEALN